MLDSWPSRVVYATWGHGCACFDPMATDDERRNCGVQPSPIVKDHNPIFALRCDRRSQRMSLRRSMSCYHVPDQYSHYTKNKWRCSFYRWATDVLTSAGVLFLRCSGPHIAVLQLSGDSLVWPAIQHLTILWTAWWCLAASPHSPLVTTIGPKKFRNYSPASDKSLIPSTQPHSHCFPLPLRCLFQLPLRHRKTSQCGRWGWSRWKRAPDRNTSCVDV